MICQTLEKIQTSDCYDAFWVKVVKLQQEYEVNEPVLPRRRKASRRLGIGTGDGHYPESPKEMHRQEYFKIYFLIKAARSEDFTAEYSFADDFDSFLLKVHFQLFGTFFSQLGQL